MTRRVIACFTLALVGLMPVRAWALSGSQPGTGGEFAGPWTQNHDAGGFDLVGGSLAEVTLVQPADAASAVGVEIHGGESTVATSPGKSATVVGGSGGASGGDGGDVNLRGGASPVGIPGKVRISSTPKTALGLPDVAAASLVDPQDGDLWWSSLDGKAYVRIAGVATDITASGGGTEAQTWTVDHDARGFDLIGIGVITSQTTAISGVMIDQSNASNRFVTYRSVLGVEISKIDSNGDWAGIASSFDIKMAGGDIEDLNNPLRLGGTSPSTLMMSDDTTVATIDATAVTDEFLLASGAEIAWDGGWRTARIMTTASNITLSDDDWGVIVTADGLTITLPDATVRKGRRFWIKNNIGSFFSGTTIQAAGGQTIDNSANIQLMTNATEGAEVISDGTDYWVIAHETNF